MPDCRIPRVTAFHAVSPYLTIGSGQRGSFEPFIHSAEALAFLGREGVDDDVLRNESHATRSIAVPPWRRSPFDGVRPYLRGHVAIGNLECPLSLRGRPSRVDMHYRAAPAFANWLKTAGFSAVSLANNHTLDYGEAALVDTIAALRKAGVRPVGVGNTETEARRGVVLSRRAGKVGVLAYNNVGPLDTYAGPDWSGCSPANRFVLAQDIRRMKSLAPIVAVSIHWGQEMVLAPSVAEQELAHSMIDLGADCVLGHHSHMAGPIELYRKKPIIYSLGNCLFGHDHSHWQGGSLWELDFAPTGAFLSGTLRMLTKATAASPALTVAEPEPAAPRLRLIAAASRVLGASLRVGDGFATLEGRVS